jgi:hypothetical protein
MNKFLNAENKVLIMRHILKVVQENHFTIVAEFEDESFPEVVSAYIIETTLPVDVGNIYDNDYHLKAFEVKKVDDFFIANVFAYVSVITVFEQEKQVLLIADGLHKHCFSCSDDFYERFNKRIEEE